MGIKISKTTTEPVSLSQKPHLARAMSMDMETGETKPLKNVWEGSSWTRFEKQRGKLMEKSNSFIGSRSVSAASPVAPEVPSAIVVVDPFSTGAHLAAAICEAGFLCVRVLSIWDSPVALLVQEGIVVEFVATVQYDDQAVDQDFATNKVNDSQNFVTVFTSHLELQRYPMNRLWMNYEGCRSRSLPPYLEQRLVWSWPTGCQHDWDCDRTVKSAHWHEETSI